MRTINKFVVHCADTPASMDIGVAEITDWHLQRGWSDIGYHFVIRRNGTVEEGRELSRPGAHARGHNAHSIGICLIGGKGGFNFTIAQLDALRILKIQLEACFGPQKWTGHTDLDSGKTCPNFDVTSLFSTV